MKLLLILALFAVPVIAQQKTPSNKAIVFVYSNATTTTVGQLRKPVFLNGKEIADVRPEHFFIARVDPGKHFFHLKNKKLGGVEKEFKVGETYYIKITWRKNGFTVVPDGFLFMPTENGEFDIKQLRPIEQGNIKDTSIVTTSL